MSRSQYGFRYVLCPLGVAGLLFASLAWGKGPFDGLEMDVIAPGQTPKGPTSHIALPQAGSGAGPLSIDGASGYQDSIADTLIRGENERSFVGNGAAGGSGGDGGSGVSRPPPPTTTKP